MLISANVQKCGY